MPLYLLLINFVQIIARFVVGIQSYRLARQKELANFLWLGAYFLLMCATDLTITLFNGFNVGAALHNPQLAATLSYVLRKGLYIAGDICLVFFVFKTFYQGRKSPFPFFLGLSIVWGIAIFGLYFLPKPILIPSDFVTFLWFAVVAYQAYGLIASDQTVEDWVKGRYLLVIVGNVLMCAAALDNVVAIFTTGKIGAFSPITNFALIAGVVLFYLAWMMPEGFRLFLNRNYKQTIVYPEYSEEELQKELGKIGA